MMSFLKKLASLTLVLLLALTLDSCSSSKSRSGLPKNLPHIALQASPATPPHSLPSYAYPFDSSGNYVSDWAAEGERRAGRPKGGSSDSQRWRSSHGGSASKAKPKARTASSGSSTRKKSSSSAVAKKSSGSGRSHTVKKGDTLSAIARRNGTSVAKIKAANGLKSDNIGIGKVLRLPRA